MLRVFPPPGAAGQQGPGLVVSGDEDGGVKVWDTRTRKQVRQRGGVRDGGAAAGVPDQGRVCFGGEVGVGWFGV